VTRALAAVFLMAFVAGGVPLAAHAEDWHRREAEHRRWEHERWREHHDYVAPPVVYSTAPVVVPPALSFSINLR
jgi:hypothetical protein